MKFTILAIFSALILSIINLGSGHQETGVAWFCCAMFAAALVYQLKTHPR